MLKDGRSFTKAQKIEADICIMGGGVAGIVLANELKEHFTNIVLLESGGENYEQEIQDLYEPAVAPQIYPNPHYSRLRFLGGASNHWANNTSTLSPIDFEKRDWVADSGWPINYETLLPYYNKAEPYCQVGTDGYEPDYWLPILDKVKLLEKGKIAELGIAKASLIPTRFFAVHGNKLALSQNVHVIKYANVNDIELDKLSGNVQRVLFSCHNDIEHSISADKFIMCFGGIENARMLLHFNIKSRNAIGNKYDNVGRYFMDHPTMVPAHLYSEKEGLGNLTKAEEKRFIVPFFQLKEDVLREHKTTNIRIPLAPSNEFTMSDGISSYHILGEALSKGRVPEHFGAHIANFVSDFDMVIEAIARKKFDTELFDEAKAFSGYRVLAMMEQTPSRDNRVKLGKVKDRFGIAKVEIDWELKSNDIRMLWSSLSLFGQDMGGLSFGRLRLLNERAERIFTSQLGFGHHHMGTTRMAETYDKGVVDPNLRVFGTENLYVSGCSVFPTGGHVPPTLTIVALSIRLAEHLKKAK